MIIEPKLAEKIFKLIALLASYTTNLNPGRPKTQCKDILDCLRETCLSEERKDWLY